MHRCVVVTGEIPNRPLSAICALRRIPELSLVLLKDWSETTGAMLVWVEFSSLYQALLEDHFPKYPSQARDGRVRDCLHRALTALLLPIPVGAVELTSSDENDYDDHTHFGLRCPPGCFVLVQLQPHNAPKLTQRSAGPEAIRSRRRRLAAKMTAASALLEAPTADEMAMRSGRLYCRRSDDNDPEWPTWEPREAGRSILETAARAWAGGTASYGAVARALNAAGLRTLKAGTPFKADSVKDVLIAVELVAGSV